MLSCFEAFKIAKFLTGIATAVVILASGATNAVSSEINTGYFGNVAIQGYDPVAYFTEKKALKGSKSYTHKWLGAQWRFSSEKHRDMFVASPQSYAPQYGGHCATGLAVHGGLTKDIDPEAWIIIDDKLYFNYSKDTQKLLTDGTVNIEQASEGWEKAQTNSH